MYLRVNLLGPGPRLIKKEYRAAVSQRLRNTDLDNTNYMKRDKTSCWCIHARETFFFKFTR
jgi:hypothetical protein